MYFDVDRCAVCDARVELRPHNEPRRGANPDGTTDERVCTNPDCPTNRDGATSETPVP